MKRFELKSFFHSVVAALVLTISATSAHAESSEGCELQSDYGAVINGVDGLVRGRDRPLSRSEVLARTKALVQQASSVFTTCVFNRMNGDFGPGRRSEPGEPKELAELSCKQDEDKAIGLVYALSKKQVNGVACFMNEVPVKFEKIIIEARDSRAISHAHPAAGGTERPGRTGNE